MFHNNRKTIGVFIQQINEEYQNLLCRGISKRAAELDYNVAIFSNFGGYGQDSYDVGERRIVGLPNYEELDGIILASDTMNMQGLVEDYRKQIESRSHCPVVSIRKEIKGYYNVLIDNGIILEDIITHLIEEHNFTRINFLSGPKDYPEITKRLENYISVLESHGIPVEEDRIYYGDLWKEAAYVAVDHWLNSSLELPQAIVCANDIMAMTVCKALEKRGISVPGQIAVTGCDDVEEAEGFIPAISTVKIPVEKTGIEAVDMIHRHNLGESQPNSAFVKQVKTIYRESCGCNKDWHGADRNRRMMKAELSDSLQFKIVRIAQMSTDLAGIATLDDFKQKVIGNWFEYDNMSHLLFCLKENWDDYNDNEEPSPDQKYVMLCGSKQEQDIDKTKFMRKDLIPVEMAEDRPMTYYFSRLHYLEHDYGYIGFSPATEHTSMPTLQAWLSIVSGALENVRMHMELNRMLSKLEDMSIRDELTGLYNRRVLDTLGKKSLQQSAENHTRVMFFIADMDKLKEINDKFGHTIGDIALKTIADALLKAADDDEICIRLSGDEFMVLGLEYDEEKAIRFSNRVATELNNFNRLNSEFGVYISYGWNLIYPNENTSIEEGLFSADYKMYQQKYEKVKKNLKTNLLS